MNPPPDFKDPYGPKRGSNRELYCVHCERFLWEKEVVWRPSDHAEGSDKTEDWLWGCKYQDCSGAGIGVDLWTDDKEHERFKRIRKEKAIEGERTRSAQVSSGQVSGARSTSK